jgi:hypothetical protein
VEQQGLVRGSAALRLAGGVSLLRADEQVFAAMMEGWADQQLARNLAVSTVVKGAATVRAFAAHADALPWAWDARMLDEWLGDLRGVRGLARSTIRNYSLSAASFCRYVTDPAYGWAQECQARFGAHPVQVVHEWNTAVHVQDAEAGPGKRAFTVDELQGFFDYADDQAVRVHGGAARGGCRCSATRCCSRPRTRSGCAARRCGCWTWPTSGPTRTLPSSAGTGCAGSGSARP